MIEFPPSEMNGVPDDVLKAIKVFPDKRDDGQRKRIASYYRKIAPELAEPRRQLARLEAELSAEFQSDAKGES